MALPSILVRLSTGTSGHVRVTVFAGPDRQHRASCGTLVACPDEALAIANAFHGAGYEVEHER